MCIRDRKVHVLRVIVLCDRDHQPQIGLDHLVFGALVTGFNPLGERYFLFLGEKRYLPASLRYKRNGSCETVSMERSSAGSTSSKASVTEEIEDMYAQLFDLSVEVYDDNSSVTEALEEVEPALDLSIETVSPVSYTHLRAH